MTIGNEKSFFLLRSYLSNIEDCIELKSQEIDYEKIKSYCLSYQKEFLQYHRNEKVKKNRYALPLVNATGLHDDTSFDIVASSKGKHEMQYTKKTTHYYDSGLNTVLDIFGEDVGRSHIINIRKGGYFSPHRDGPSFDYPFEETFRLIYCILDCESYKLHFALENSKILQLSSAKFYFINTMKIHSAYSFSDNCFFLISNIRISQNSIKLLNILTAK